MDVSSEDLPGLLREYDELAAIFADWYGRTIAARRSARQRVEAMGHTPESITQRCCAVLQAIKRLDPTAFTPEMHEHLEKIAWIEDVEQEDVPTTDEVDESQMHTTGAWFDATPIAAPAAVAWPPVEASDPKLATGLIPLLDLDATRSELAFLKLPRGRIRICVSRWNLWRPVLTQINLDGSAAWWGDPPEPDDEDDPGVADLEPLYLRADPVPTGDLATGAIPTDRSGREWNLSYVGGHPQWEQYPQYPICPRCSRPMTFVGQVGETGVYHYAFMCPECKTAGVLSQQD